MNRAPSYVEFTNLMASDRSDDEAWVFFWSDVHDGLAHQAFPGFWEEARSRRPSGTVREVIDAWPTDELKQRWRDHIYGRRWPSRLAWTNLYKVSPAAGWNPGGDLQRAQRPFAMKLLQLELAELEPRRVLALTGGWIPPFVGELGLDLERRSGLVEMVGQADGRAWVVAKHPMGKPSDQFVAEVRMAFDELGASFPRP